jgi:hypothetical protein
MAPVSGMVSPLYTVKSGIIFLTGPYGIPKSPCSHTLVGATMVEQLLVRGSAILIIIDSYLLD